MAHIMGYTSFLDMPLVYFTNLVVKNKELFIDVLSAEEDEEPDKWNQVVETFRDTLDIVSELSPEEIDYLTITEHSQENFPNEYRINQNLKILKRYFQGRWPTIEDFFHDFEEENNAHQLKRRRSARLEGIVVPDFAQLRIVKRRMNPARLEMQASQSAKIRLSDGQYYDLKHILDIYRHSNGQETLLRHPLTHEDRALMTDFLHHHDYNENGKRIKGGLNRQSRRKITRKSRKKTTRQSRKK